MQKPWPSYGQLDRPTAKIYDVFSQDREAGLISE